MFVFLAPRSPPLAKCDEKFHTGREESVLIGSEGALWVILFTLVLKWIIEESESTKQQEVNERRQKEMCCCCCLSGSSPVWCRFGLHTNAEPSLRRKTHKRRKSDVLNETRSESDTSLVHKHVCRLSCCEESFHWKINNTGAARVNASFPSDLQHNALCCFIYI